MKKYIFLFIALFTAQLSVAQVREVTTDIYGQYEIVVQVGDDAYIVIDQYGEILDIDMQQNSFEYYSNFNDYEAEKIKRINDIQFTYYSAFNDYESGKIKKIGNVDFSYYSGFNDYEKGKIKKIGNIDFTYYSSFNDYETGKVKKIGSTNFNYYSNFNDYETGKIKTIGSSSFSYFSDRESKKMIGKLKSGTNIFTDNGILFRIKYSFRGNNDQKSPFPCNQYRDRSYNQSH